MNYIAYYLYIIICIMDVFQLNYNIVYTCISNRKCRIVITILLLLPSDRGFWFSDISHNCGHIECRHR